MQLAPPGAAWSYNNAGFGVAGRIVEVVTGKPFGDAVDELVFGRSGSSSRSRASGDLVVFPFAVGACSVRPPPGRRSAGPAEAVHARRRASPRAESAMSMTDAARYARFHLGNGTNMNGERVLTRATLDEMQRPQLRKQGYDEDIGLAWHLRTVGGVKTVAHGGTLTGHVLLLEMVPDKNFAIADTHQFRQGLAPHPGRRARGAARLSRRGLRAEPGDWPSRLERNSALRESACRAAGADSIRRPLRAADEYRRRTRRERSSGRPREAARPRGPMRRCHLRSTAGSRDGHRRFRAGCVG